jgi:FkbM family methyltransferase
MREEWRPWVRAAASRPWQRALDRVHEWALRGLGFGSGGSLARSGELDALGHVRRRLARRGGSGTPVVFDVGAHEGRYALAVRRAFEGRVSVFAFEPSPAAFERLARNVASDAAIRVFPFGLGRLDEERTLHADRPGSGLGSVHRRRLDHLGLRSDPLEGVRLRRLDDVCAETGVERIDLLKLDVEGHELEALAGARRMLEEGRIDFLAFEFGGCNVDSRTYFQDFFYLLDPRYRIHRVLRGGLRPVPKYLERHEVFLTTNYLAERRETSGPGRYPHLPPPQDTVGGVG